VPSSVNASFQARLWASAMPVFIRIARGWHDMRGVANEKHAPFPEAARNARSHLPGQDTENFDAEVGDTNRGANDLAASAPA